MNRKALSILLLTLAVSLSSFSCNGSSEPEDNESPVISCTSSINVTVDAYTNSAVVVYDRPTVTDNVSTITRQTAGYPSGAEFPVGVTTNSFEAKDPTGNTATCSFDITVTQKETPEDYPYLMGDDPTPNGKTWKIVPEFTDEFEDSVIDLAKWNIEPQGHTHLNWPGRIPGLFQKESFDIVDGDLTIEVGVLPEPITISPYGSPLTYLYHGGILRSRTTTSIGEGHYYECKMKMNKTEMGGGFWLMGYDPCEKKHEIDITESVGHISDLTEEWAKNWDQLYHSNAILRQTSCHEETRSQGALILSTKNHEKYYVYGFWWKSPTELIFYIDGEYAYTLTPPQDFDQEMFMQFSIESYDWNPIPADGGQIAKLDKEDRTTHIEYIRSFELVDIE